MKTTAVNENQQSEVQTNMKAAVVNAFHQQLEIKDVPKPSVNIADEKLDLAKSLGADEVVNGMNENPAEAITEKVGGVRAAISVAVTKKAFEQAYRSVKRGGTLVVVGLPNDELPIPIFNTVLNGVSVKSSIVGTRLDMKEALDFAARSKVKAQVETAPLDEVNSVFDKMTQGKINGRIVLTL